MKIRIITIGKTSASYLKEGIAIYLKRLDHYANVEVVELADVAAKGLSPQVLKEKEGELLLKTFKAGESVVLLDEKGNGYTSVQFSEVLQKKMNAGTKGICFVVGGAFGFSQAVYDRAEMKLSFSKMTYSHEMIRLLLAEQLYRAFTILKGESYHHE